MELLAGQSWRSKFSAKFVIRADDHPAVESRFCPSMLVLMSLSDTLVFDCFEFSMLAIALVVVWQLSSCS